MQVNFGVGYLTSIASGANPTPVQFGVLKDGNIDIEFTTKELRGAYQWPVDIARAAGKITGKAKYAEIDSGAVAQILNTTPAAPSAGVGNVIVDNEQAAIPGTPYQITVANSANFILDLGVTINGVTATRVASAPATGQYSVSAGVYTFAAADTAKTAAIRYSYRLSTQNVTVFQNQLMGAAPTVSLYLGVAYKSKNVYIYLPAIVIPKLSLGLKSEDYTESDISWDAFADATGNIMYWSATE